MNFENHQCKLCSKPCDGKRGISNHLIKVHELSLQEYVTTHLLNGVIPQCKCGCGQDVSWHKTLCRYNEYVSGHNARLTGFTVHRQPKLSSEQIKNRNDSIRLAYTLKREAIQEKISDAVKTKWQDDEYREKVVQSRREMWSDDGYKKKQSASRKRSWEGEAGQERRKKVFTEEFGKKIAAANMNRDIKRTSQEEEQFYQHVIANIDANAVRSHWHNGELVKCFDVKIGNVLIEFDGIYWHGLDRDADFTYAQLCNVINDIKKNNLARQMGCELLRIRSSDEWSKCMSVNDLRDIAYHHQTADGSVIRQGTFTFDDDLRPIITREQLIRINEPQFGGRGRQWTQDTLLPLVLELFHEHANFHGWFYPHAVDIEESLNEIIRSVTLDRLSCDHDISSKNGAGTGWLKSRFKSYWHVDGGPVESFWDTRRFSKVLQYRLGLNNSKPYDYTLSDGTKISCHETFDINVKNVRFGLIVQRNAVSFFKPHAAAVIWRRALGDVKDPVVWDPSGGFGARMLGFAAMYPHGYYSCTEPANMTHADLTAAGKELISVLPQLRIDVIKCGSEQYVPTADSVDCVFTSPPYFSKEKYFDEPGQCWRDHSNAKAWYDNYLIPTCKNAFHALKPGASMIINIDEENKQLIIDAALTCGFALRETWRLGIGSDHFRRKRGISSEKFEPILVFAKQ